VKQPLDRMKLSNKSSPALRPAVEQQFVLPSLVPRSLAGVLPMLCTTMEGELTHTDIETYIHTYIYTYIQTYIDISPLPIYHVCLSIYCAGCSKRPNSWEKYSCHLKPSYKQRRDEEEHKQVSRYVIIV